MTKLEELRTAYEAATPGEWKPCRAHEEFSGPYFEIDEAERGEYEARPIVSIDAQTRRVAAAHDLFTFHVPDATFISLAHNLMPQLLEAVELMQLACEYNTGSMNDYQAKVERLLEKLK